jgi:hypothetical protein
MIFLIFPIVLAQKEELPKLAQITEVKYYLILLLSPPPLL